MVRKAKSAVSSPHFVQRSSTWIERTFHTPRGWVPEPSPEKAGAKASSPMARPSWATSPGCPSSPAGATQCAAVATTLPFGLSTTLAVHQCSPFAMSTPTVGKGGTGRSPGALRKPTAHSAAIPATAAADAPFTTGLTARRGRGSVRTSPC